MLPLFSLSTYSLSSGFNSKWVKLAAVLLFTSVFIASIYQPLPDNFEQPWKYRLVCFGATLSSFMGHALESVNVMNRLNFTRLAYHYAVGSFNIRDSSDHIDISDEAIEHLSMRIYRPVNRTLTDVNGGLSPTIIFYHGGGHFLGTADILEPVTYLLAKHTNYLVIYIEFRLIPEHKYPAALSDSLLATEYLIKNNKQYHIDLNNLILVGDSAGGNLATVISQHLIENRIAQPKLQVLIYPILQFFDFTLPSYRLNLPLNVLGNIDHENFKNFIHYMTGLTVDDTIFANGHTSRVHKESMFANYVNAAYLPSYHRTAVEPIQLLNSTCENHAELAKILLSTRISPLLRDDAYLARNTPENTVLITTEMDIIRDDGFIYAARLKHAGKHVVHKHYENLFHGIFGLQHGPLYFEASTDMMAYVSKTIVSIVSNQK